MELRDQPHAPTALAAGVVAKRELSASFCGQTELFQLTPFGRLQKFVQERNMRAVSLFHRLCTSYIIQH